MPSSLPPGAGNDQDHDTRSKRLRAPPTPRGSETHGLLFGRRLARVALRLLDPSASPSLSSQFSCAAGDTFDAAFGGPSFSSVVRRLLSSLSASQPVSWLDRSLFFDSFRPFVGVIASL